ncbi:MAG: M23 family metallopeptidase [Flavobacteriaceae bacterium]
MKQLLVLFFLTTSLLRSQENIPQDFFSNPLDISMYLSGNFGELRSNHFHSGLDIKTQQKEGFPVYATADGYIQRIKVSHYGYGKALYIQHPNGHSTVYAHLQKYAGDIQDYVKQNQYKKESYEIELFPEATMLPVKKGDIIAYTGNSGSSGGPHLHFEIRDAASRPMNPLLFGIKIPDTTTPLVNSVFAYPYSDDAHVDQSQNPVKLRLKRQKDGSYVAENITAFGKIGFGISAYDQQNGASNKNGTYQIKTKYNGEPYFTVLFNKFSFDETRYLNRYIDYHYFETNKSRVQKLFRETNNPLSVIVQEVNQGFVQVEDGFASMYTMEVSDFDGNTVLITVPIEGKKEEIKDPKQLEKTSDFIYADQATSITKGKFSIYIPSESLYEDTYLAIEAKGDTLVFHEDVIPIHKNITITVDASNYQEADLNKLYIGRLNYKGVPYYNSTSRKGTKLSAGVRTFGTYALALDTIPPNIAPKNFKDGQWISKNNTLEIKIEDKETGVSSYRATINGKFILTEYDYKKDVLVYDFDDQVTNETENNLQVIVVDNVGNSATFEATFFRK